MSVFPSSRFSPAVDTMPRTAWNGFVKLRLGHSRKGSVFVVEHIFLATSSGWIFLEPSFFGPPSLSFMPRGRHQAIFSADVLAPRASLGARLILAIEIELTAQFYRLGAQLTLARSTELPVPFHTFKK
jgi:hypothetical protein